MRPQRLPATWAVACLCACVIACGDDDDGDGSKAGSGGTGTGNAGTSGNAAAGSGGSGGTSNAGSGGPTSSSEIPPEFPGIPSVEYGPPPSNCTEAGDNRGDTLVLALTPSNTVLLLTTRDGELQVNGVKCTGVENPTAIEITGSSESDTIVLDWSWGTVPASLRGGTITIDSADANDTIAIAATRDADTVQLGSDNGTRLYFGGAAPRIVARNQETLILSTGPGDDTISATGGGELGAALTAALTLYAGAGNDTIQGGAGDDQLHGDDGDDVFTTASNKDGADGYEGGAGRDSLSYEKRTFSLSVTVDGQANDGEPDEKDSVDDSIEVLIAGQGEDVIVAGPNANTLTGGPGNDKLSGGEGDDTFLETTSVQGSDIMNGGPGDDTVDYSGRRVDLTVTLCAPTASACTEACDCTADDGAANEKDNLVLVENVIAGDGNDKLTGSSASNTFFGNAGDDELRGEGGNDTLYGDTGNNQLFGGDGDDTLFTADGANNCDGGNGQGDICICLPDNLSKNCELR